MGQKDYSQLQTNEIAFVAAEEHQITTGDNKWTLYVHLCLQGPHAGLWLWAIIPDQNEETSGGLSGYSTSRNEAINNAHSSVMQISKIHVPTIHPNSKSYDGENNDGVFYTLN